MQFRPLLRGARGCDVQRNGCQIGQSFLRLRVKASWIVFTKPDKGEIPRHVIGPDDTDMSLCQFNLNRLSKCLMRNVFSLC